MAELEKELGLALGEQQVESSLAGTSTSPSPRSAEAPQGEIIIGKFTLRYSQSGNLLVLPDFPLNMATYPCFKTMQILHSAGITNRAEKLVRSSSAALA